MIVYRKPWTRQPQGAVGVAQRWLARSPWWVSNYASASTGAHLTNAITGARAISQDANNEFLQRVRRDGIAGENSKTTQEAALNYLVDGSVLNGDSAYTTLLWFEFDASATNAQALHFRVNNKLSLDTFSKTATSLNWGTDWAGAWNGASQQTLSNLTDGQFVCVGASVTSAGGARLFHQGRFSGTKSGSAFTQSGITNVQVVAQERYRLYGQALFRQALSDAEMIALTGNPWQLFAPREIYIPTAAAPALPTLTYTGPISGTVTSTGWRHRVTGT